MKTAPSLMSVALDIPAQWAGGSKQTTAEIDTTHITCGISPYSLVNKMRASTYLIGAELGRFGWAKVGMPGGCDFGVRPIDQHVKGFEALGAEIFIENGYINARCPGKLTGSSIYFDISSVGATCNIMLAACLAEGKTIIDNAAREPHIVDLANFLNTCGANITGAGTNMIKIHGVKKLHGCEYAIIPDMIEAGTYMAAVASAGGRLKIRNVIPKHIESISAKFLEMGVAIVENDDYITVSSNGRLNRANVKTLPYPGFPPTCSHRPQPALHRRGNQHNNRRVCDNRFRYLEDLRRMGQAYRPTEPRQLSVSSGCRAPGQIVDLRAGAAMIIAGLAASGTTIEGEKHARPRYYDIVGKPAR